MPKLVLVVDDSITMVKSVKSSLELGGFAVETASDGCGALAKLKDGLKPDLIVTDVNMPKMGGLELIRNIKALPGFRFTPILTLTTEAGAATRDEGRKLGATGWLVKPVGGADLLRVVKQILPGS